MQIINKNFDQYLAEDQVQKPTRELSCAAQVVMYTSQHTLGKSNKLQI